MSIRENILTIRQNIAGVSPSGAVLLVAATKMNDAEAVSEAVKAGIDACGENKVQEFLKKNAQGAYTGAPVHFIGHLQKNKLNKIVGAVDLIQSVDSAELLTLISKRAQTLGITQDILIEINIGAEASKSGFSPEALPGALSLAATQSGICVRGLMCVAPIVADAEENVPYFAQMKQLFVDNSGKKYDNVIMDFLSMGMTGDYIEAIKAGANMVRIGSAIFGARNY